MRKSMLIIFIVCYLGFVLLANICFLYTTYRDFYKCSSQNDITRVIGKAENIAPLKIFGDYTGAGAGYGFFGINVRSRGVLVAECDGKRIAPYFNSYETELRFSSMLDAISDNMLEQHDSSAADRCIDKYNDLAFKNIAARLLSNCHHADSITISYCLVDGPSLEAYRAKRSSELVLQPLKTITYQIH